MRDVGFMTETALLGLFLFIKADVFAFKPGSPVDAD
jgi:hypothetical protein